MGRGIYLLVGAGEMSGQKARLLPAEELCYVGGHNWGRQAMAEPFDVFTVRDLRLRSGDQAMALDLYEAGRATLAQAAKLADLSMEAFIELLGKAEVPAVSYPPEDLVEELENAR